MIVTTETAHNLPVIERIGIISAECVYGMHIFKDLLTDIRNVAGGRSDTFQKAMRSAKDTALFELRKEAHTVGAHAVVGVTISYNQIGQAVGSMLMVSAIGTAVRLEAPSAH
ncbi:YbjQ family protein [Thioclava sp. BHET1]|nr:YbjQ family protein [Thioclava sp. BHET1]